MLLPAIHYKWQLFKPREVKNPESPWPWSPWAKQKSTPELVSWEFQLRFGVYERLGNRKTTKVLSYFCNLNGIMIIATSNYEYFCGVGQWCKKQNVHKNGMSGSAMTKGNIRNAWNVRLSELPTCCTPCVGDSKLPPKLLTLPLTERKKFIVGAVNHREPGKSWGTCSIIWDLGLVVT